MYGGSPGWEQNMREMGGINARNIFNRQYLDMLGNLSRMGLNKSGWKTTLMNPAYQSMGQNLAQTEVGIDQQRAEWERLKLMREMAEKRKSGSGLGGLLGGAGGLALAALTGGAALPFFGIGAGLGGLAGGLSDR